MADIVNLSDKKVNKKEVEEVHNLFKELISGEDFNAIQALMTLLQLDDENFSVVAPGAIQSFQQSINNPNDKLALVQALNASGIKAEDLIDSFQAIISSAEQLDFSTAKIDFLKQFLGSIINVVSETEGISKRFIQIPIELCHENAKIPQYANISDSGMDVYALDDYIINPGETKLIPTGIKLAIPPGYEIQVRPKSGRALKTKLRIANTPGTIDAGYRDEIGVIVENVEAPIKDLSYEFDDNGKPIITSIKHGSCHVIGKGEKFCQLVLCEVPKAALYRVNSVNEIGENRGGGFGSTGLK